MTTFSEAHVVTCFLRNRGEVLLLRRSDAVGSYRGMWGGVAGYAEGEPERAAHREIAEETGLAGSVTLVNSGEPFPVEDESLDKRWIVHPFLFDCDSRDLSLDWESTDAEWVSPTEILRRDTVPQLWTSYVRVAPTVESVVEDVEHGSAYLSLRGLEVLRDRAAILVQSRATFDASRSELVSIALRLVSGRPAMTVLANRVHRVMNLGLESHASDIVGRRDGVGVAGRVEEVARSAIHRAVADDDEAAHRAARYVAGRKVVTLSRSETVTRALTAAEPKPTDIAVMESRPGGEGSKVAEALARDGHSVTLLPDSAIASLVAERTFELVMVGADTIFPSGEVGNKVGSIGAALTARRSRIPFYVVSATDKLEPKQDALAMERGNFMELYRGDAPLQCFAPIFEVIPADLVTDIVTEKGVLSSSDLRTIASALEGLRDWRRDEDAG